MCCSCGCGIAEDDHGNPANITLSDLADAGVAAGIAPGQAAANIAATLRALADDPLSKAADAEPQRYVLGVAYQAGPDPRIATAADGGRDYFAAEELEKAAWSFLQSGPRVGLFHMDGTDENGGAATIVESYIYRNDEPWNLGNDIVVRKGDWLVGAILDEPAWRLYKAGKLTGWSPQGTARRLRRGEATTGI